MEKEQETKFKDNFKKWNQTLSSEIQRIQDIKADLNNLQRNQVDIDIQGTETI